MPAMQAVDLSVVAGKAFSAPAWVAALRLVAIRSGSLLTM
jgi:hypothetical protein